MEGHVRRSGRKTRARLVEIVCCDCGKEAIVQKINHSKRPREACDDCFWSFPCAVCGESVRYGEATLWKRAKKREPVTRMHDECREKKRQNKERARRDRMLLLSDASRLDGIEKELHEAWARRVKERDGMRCIVCGTGEGEMHAHHVRPVHRHPYLSTHIPNGVTLCRECHLGEGGVHGGGVVGSEVVWELRRLCD